MPNPRVVELQAELETCLAANKTMQAGWERTRQELDQVRSQLQKTIYASQPLPPDPDMEPIGEIAVQVQDFSPAPEYAEINDSLEYMTQPEDPPAPEAFGIQEEVVGSTTECLNGSQLAARLKYAKASSVTRPAKELSGEDFAELIKERQRKMKLEVLVWRYDKTTKKFYSVP